MYGRLDLQLAKFHPAGVIFGTVGLEGEVAGSEVFGQTFGISVVDDFPSIEPDLNVRAKGFDAERIPLPGVAVLVFGVSLVEPVVEIETDRFVGDSATNVDLESVVFLLGLVAEINPAVVFSVFVDLEVEAEVEVLEFGFGEEQARAFGITILTAGEDALLAGQLGAAYGSTFVE